MAKKRGNWKAGSGGSKIKAMDGGMVVMATQW